MNKRLLRLGSVLAATALLLGSTACGQTDAKPATEGTGDAIGTAAKVPETDAAAPATHYTPPPFAVAEYHADAAAQYGAATIDTSATAQGYVAVTAQSEAGLKFQVIHGETTYNYDLPNDGTPTIFVLQSGDGDYALRVLQNTSGTKYATLAETTTTVTLESEFAPFLRTNQFVSYTADSACVKKAAELIADAPDDAGAVTAIYDYICSNIVYDTAKAQTVRDGYLPDPDATLAAGKGICFDYAALAAAMMRSQGIPVKLVTGYVSPGDIYHAWNMVYLEDSGWISVSFEAPADAWSRVDLTFAAGGGAAYAGDGTSYTDRYTY